MSTALPAPQVLDLAKRCGIKAPDAALVEFATLAREAEPWAAGDAFSKTEILRRPAVDFAARNRQATQDAVALAEFDAMAGNPEPLHPPGGQVDSCSALPHVRTAAAAPNAGSATGFDLAKMSRDEVIKIMIKRDMLSQHGYRTLLNGDFISLNLDHLTALANAALARATPQHPEAPAAAVRAAERIDAMHKGVVGVFAALKAEHDAATPQHSVTEQAAAAWIDEFGNVWPLGAYSPNGKPNYHDAHKRGWKPLFRAQPLASTAATQPEQASDFAVRFIEQRAQKYLDENAHSDWDTGSVIFNCGEAGQDYYNSLVELADDIRAAFAIPASTARIQPESATKAEVHTLRRLIECAEKLDARPRPMCRDCADENGTCPNSGLECDMRKLFADAKALHNRLAAPASTAASEQQASVSDATLESALMDVLTQHTELSTDAIDERVPQLVSAIRATIPSEADEHEDFDRWADERLFSNPPLPVTAFDAWKAARTLAHRATTATKR